MPLDSEIIVVSGLPRSGTSLMMQMLIRGGIPVLTDHVRGADADNPRGYYEFEAVKKTKADPSWLADARGKAVKMVSSLLYDLPDTENFRVIFQRRDLDEVLESQEKMLNRLGRSAAPRDAMKKSFNLHLERLFEWLPKQSHLRILEVSYNSILADPKTETQRIVAFLDNVPDRDRVLEAIDPTLYRNRRA
jgi:hypothetical protein